MQVKGIGRVGFSWPNGNLARFFWFGFAVGPPGHGLQQLAGILEVATPQHCRAFASQAVSGICGNAVIGNHDAFGRQDASFRLPYCRMCFGYLNPADCG
jgi:hypothetical protein